MSKQRDTYHRAGTQIVLRRQSSEAEEGKCSYDIDKRSYLHTPNLPFIVALVGSEATRMTIIISQETLAARSDREVLHLVLAAAHLDRETLEVRSVQGITTTICNRAERAKSKVSQTLSSERSAALYWVI